MSNGAEEPQFNYTYQHWLVAPYPFLLVMGCLSIMVKRLVLHISLACRDSDRVTASSIQGHVTIGSA